VGASAQWNRYLTLYGNFSYDERIDGSAFFFDAKLGFRVNW
jgi:hypothetical protein